MAWFLPQCPCSRVEQPRTVARGRRADDKSVPTLSARKPRGTLTPAAPVEFREVSGYSAPPSPSSQPIAEDLEPAVSELALGEAIHTGSSAAPINNCYFGVPSWVSPVSEGFPESAFFTPEKFLREKPDAAESRAEVTEPVTPQPAISLCALEGDSSSHSADSIGPLATSSSADASQSFPDKLVAALHRCSPYSGPDGKVITGTPDSTSPYDEVSPEIWH